MPHLFSFLVRFVFEHNKSIIMAKIKEPKVEQPSIEEQREYVSLRDNDATIVNIVGTKKKYKIRWAKKGQISKLSRLLVRKSSTDEKDNGQDSPLDAIIDDTKLTCKVAAIYILDGYWKLKFRYWFLWRWFYYIKQYDDIQLQPILDEGKKKVPLIQFLSATISLTEAKATLMNMRTEEAERILRELAMEKEGETESQGNG